MANNSAPVSQRTSLTTWLPQCAHSYEEALAPLEGVVEFVTSLKTPKAVASGSSLELVRMKLDRVGLALEFGANVYTCEHSRSKPHPDVFLQAAEGLGVLPGRIAVIEDSTNGVPAHENWTAR
jgi:HAD superfamily hydrolase (TIGR01509 family)